MIYLTDEEFAAIMTHIKDNYGVNLSKKRSLIEGRLSNHLTALGFDNYKDYFSYAMNDKTGDEMTVLISKLTTNHTYFMREGDHFDFYRETVLPWIDKTLRTRDRRIWSAGCSSGQEPYTLSIITLDYLGANAADWDSTILASDISNKVLLTAREGIYKKEELNGLSERWLKKYFTALDGDRHRVSDVLRSNVTFRNFNLLSPFPFKKPFQVILCRNVMIYFDSPTKEQLIEKFYNALQPGGYLFIGLSESLSGLRHKFKPVRPSIYRKAD